MASSSSAAADGTHTLRVGVLAVQGSFREHIAALRRCAQDLAPALPSGTAWTALEAVEVRVPQELAGLHGLIIPGGESTTMANVAQRNGLIPSLQQFGTSHRPIWGTCAGLILLADRALGQKMGGQALVGGLDITVHRNFFGSQINSFETELPSPAVFAQEQQQQHTQQPNSSSSSSSSSADAQPAPFRAVFIRAPAIIQTGPEVEVLADYAVIGGPKEVPKDAVLTEELQQLQKLEKVAVAVRQGHLLATAFHPELTADLRWHQLFIRMVAESASAATPAVSATSTPSAAAAPTAPSSLLPISHPGDLPVFASDSQMRIELKPL